jgi:hypothetical protein
MHLFSHTHFVACLTCGVLHPCLRRSPTQRDSSEQEASESYQQFRSAHAGHLTSEVHRHDSESFADRPLWDPMASSAFEVTDGWRTYVVISTRTSIEEPRTYRIMPGSIEVHTSDISVDDRDIRRALDYAFYPHAVRGTKIDRFVAALREVISHVEPDELAIAFDAADDPQVSIAPMPEVRYAELLSRCAQIFDGWELSRVSSFLQSNCGEDGLLALRVRRHYLTALTI